MLGVKVERPLNSLVISRRIGKRLIWQILPPKHIYLELIRVSLFFLG